MTDTLPLADVLCDHLGHVRVQIERLTALESALKAAMEAAWLAANYDAQVYKLAPVTLTPELADLVDEAHGLAAAPVPDLATLVEEDREPDPPSASSGKYDLAEVARLACDAIEAGESVRFYVYDHLTSCPSSAMASNLITQARKAGHHIPHVRPGRQPNPEADAKKAAIRNDPDVDLPESTVEQVPGKGFVCSTCDHSAKTVRDIIRHTRGRHGRDAYTSERMPV